MKSKLGKYRKVLMLLPLVVLMVVIVVYLRTSTFKQSNGQAGGKDTLSRLNTKLPEPNIKDTGKNKLEIYMQMQQDSLKQRSEMETPSVKRFFNQGRPEEAPFANEVPVVERSSPHHKLARQEERVNEQLARIQKELNSVPNEGSERSKQHVPESEPSPDIARLEQLMATLQADTSGDPELQRLDAMLDKIIRVQNPDAHHKPPSKDSARPVESINQSPETVRPASVFYGLEQNMASLSKQKSALRAVVHTDQTVVTGSTIKLRLLENIYIGQQEIPANTFIYGICNIANERLTIDLDKIVYNNVIIPVKLTAYDNDGITGISVPGAITRDGAKEGLDRTLQTLSLNSLDPSLAAQATSAGIQSLKSLLSRKVKQVKVTVKANHLVYLQ